MDLDVRLDGVTITTEDLLRLETGDILSLDFAIDRPLLLEINGKEKYRGQIVDTTRNRGFIISEQTTDAA
jgi:flagellar motor switch protein FliM